MIQKSGICWGRISVCTLRNATCLQKGSGKRPREDILNIKQRRATQSSFRSHKYCVFPGQGPCCTFNISLCRIPCNCHVTVSKIWLIPDQRQAREVAEQSGMAVPWRTAPKDKMQADTLMGSESGNGHSLRGPSRLEGEKKKKKEEGEI